MAMTNIVTNATRTSENSTGDSGNSGVSQSPVVAPPRNRSNDPFYVHEALEREWKKQLEEEQRKKDHFSKRKSASSFSSSATAASSNATIKWKDASDLQFRMVTDVLNGHSGINDLENNSSFSGVSKDGRVIDGEQSRFERMSRSKTNSGNVASSGIGRTDSNNRLQRFKDGLWNALNLGGYTNYYADFVFTDYKSKYFAEVRDFCGIGPEVYTKAFENTANEKFTEGRSGAFMFSSVDSRFIVKTTTEPELRKLLKIMPRYLNHLRTNPHSLIIKFLGAHCITMYSTKIYFLVMLNVFPRERLSEKYDLKGSWVNRSGKIDGSRLTRRERMMTNKAARSAPLLLDNDLQQKINIEESVARALRNQMMEDSKFLASTYQRRYFYCAVFDLYDLPGLNLMDYSLLVGVVTRHFEVKARPLLDDALDYPPLHLPSERSSETHLETSANSIINEAHHSPSSAQDRSSSVRTPATSTKAAVAPNNPLSKDDDGAIGAEVVQAPGTYYFGIIDILQEWNWSKKFERFYKTYFRLRNSDGISAIQPQKYQKRFMKRVADDIFDLSAEARDSSHTRNSSCYPSSNRASFRQKSRATDNASVCVPAESQRNSAFTNDDLDYAEFAY
jgi:hypothetical protein